MIGQADAAFDVLTMIVRFEAVTEGVLEGEVHMVAYMAFLLSLYAGEPTDSWGYGFASTPNAAPFSDAINEALKGLRRGGLVADRGPTLRATRRSESELLLWRELSRNRHREPFVRAAAEATAQVSLPTMSHGLNREPQLAYAAQVGGLRGLPDELSINELHQHFALLDEVLDVPLANTKNLDADLMVRAALWLTYLSSDEGA